MSQIIQTPEQQMYLARLMGNDYTIQYRSEQTNAVADALSRISETHDAELLVLTVPSFSFIKTLKKELEQNPEFLAKVQEINSTGVVDFRLENGLIFYKDRIWFPSNSPFTRILLDEFHKTPTGGHMGITKTLARLSTNFFGVVCVMTFTALYLLVWIVNTPNMKQRNLLGCYVLCLYPTHHGRIYHLTLLWVYLHIRGIRLSLWWWIVSQRAFT
jgi:hypothetical protein